MKKNSRGFTLVELLVVVAILGILGAVSYPSYNAYVKKAKRADAIDSLLSQAARMEEFYINNDSYDGATVASPISSEGLYKITITEATNFVYTLTATPVESDPECTTLTLNSLGVKAGTGTDADNCW